MGLSNLKSGTTRIKNKRFLSAIPMPEGISVDAKEDAFPSTFKNQDWQKSRSFSFSTEDGPMSSPVLMVLSNSVQDFIVY